VYVCVGGQFEESTLKNKKGTLDFENCGLVHVCVDMGLLRLGIITGLTALIHGRNYILPLFSLHSSECKSTIQIDGYIFFLDIYCL
jgi:hypothetical protein